MDRELEEGTSWAVMLLMVCILMIPYTAGFRAISKASFAKSAVVNDKTAVMTTAELGMSTNTMSRQDILMMFVVVDQYMLTPKEFRIEDKVTIKVNSTFMENRAAILRTALQVMPEDKPYLRKLVVDEHGVKAWLFEPYEE